MAAADRTRFRRARMAALGLAPALGGPDCPASALDVTRSLGALQAQDYGSGVWSLGLRSGLTLAEVEQAVERREVVRTWPMRGTIHWVPAEDARWMCQLLAAPRSTALATRYAQLGLGESDIELAGRLFEEHLTEPMSRPDVVALLADAGIDPSDQRAYHLVGHHCMTGLLCQGPVIGKQPSFVLIDSWIPHSRRLSREEGLAVMAERYLRGHGPVTEKDLAGWLLKPLGLARAGAGPRRAAGRPRGARRAGVADTRRRGPSLHCRRGRPGSPGSLGTQWSPPAAAVGRVPARLQVP